MQFVKMRIKSSVLTMVLKLLKLKEKNHSTQKKMNKFKIFDYMQSNTTCNYTSDQDMEHFHCSINFPCNHRLVQNHAVYTLYDHLLLLNIMSKRFIHIFMCMGNLFLFISECYYNVRINDKQSCVRLNNGHPMISVF